MSAKILVTGATGLIGGQLSRELVVAGYEVRTLSASRDINLGQAQHMIADITSPAAQELAAGVDVIVHLAAISDASGSLARPLDYIKVNADGTLAMLEAARTNGARFILASSQRIYRSSLQPLREDAPLEPVDPYGYSKLVAEQWAEMYRRFYGVPVTVLRFFSVFGPGQRLTGGTSGVVSIFVQRALKGQSVSIKSNALRDFTYVTDATAAIRLALEHPQPSGTFNAATGVATSVRDLAYLIRDVTAKPFEIDEEIGDDTASFVADITLARRHFGYQPAISLEEGLRAYVRSQS